MPGFPIDVPSVIETVKFSEFFLGHARCDADCMQPFAYVAVRVFWIVEIIGVFHSCIIARFTNCVKFQFVNLTHSQIVNIPKA